MNTQATVVSNTNGVSVTVQLAHNQQVVVEASTVPEALAKVVEAVQSDLIVVTRNEDGTVTAVASGDVIVLSENQDPRIAAANETLQQGDRVYVSPRVSNGS